MMPVKDVLTFLPASTVQSFGEFKLLHRPSNSLDVRDKLSSKNLNSVRNSDKLKNPAVQSSGDFFSLSTGAAEFFLIL